MLGLLLSCEKSGWTAARMHGLGPSWGGGGLLLCNSPEMGGTGPPTFRKPHGGTCPVPLFSTHRERAGSSVTGVDGTERFHRNAFQRFMCQASFFFFFPFQIEFFLFSKVSSFKNFSYGSRGRGRGENECEQSTALWSAGPGGPRQGGLAVPAPLLGPSVWPDSSSKISK